MTISDIAKMAGVSSAAVSRYLNGGPLSEQKRAVIHEVVEKTGYPPENAPPNHRHTPGYRRPDSAHRKSESGGGDRSQHRFPVGGADHGRHCQ